MILEYKNVAVGLPLFTIVNNTLCDILLIDTIGTEQFITTALTLLMHEAAILDYKFVVDEVRLTFRVGNPDSQFKWNMPLKLDIGHI